MLLELIGRAAQIDPTPPGLGDDFWNYGEPIERVPDRDRAPRERARASPPDGIGYGQTCRKAKGIGLAGASQLRHLRRLRGEGEGRSTAQIRVPEIHMAIDCGFAANPERIRSQMQGAAVMGMTAGAPFRDHVRERCGRAIELLRLRDGAVGQLPAETWSTHIVPHPFSVHATGVGEPGVPPIAPAIANGLAVATGERRRSLPIGTTV